MNDLFLKVAAGNAGHPCCRSRLQYRADHRMYAESKYRACEAVGFAGTLSDRLYLWPDLFLQKALLGRCHLLA